MAEPVGKKSYQDGWTLVLDQDCVAKVTRDIEASAMQPSENWFQHFDALFSGVPNRKLFRNAVAHLRSLKSAPEKLTTLIVPPSELDIDPIPGLDEYLGLKQKEPSEVLKHGLKFCLKKTTAVDGESEIKSAREAYIQQLAGPIADPTAKKHFIGIIKGLAANQSDEIVWQETYDTYFGWSESELAVLDETFLLSENALAEGLAEDTKVLALLNEQPEISGYLAGLISQAKLNYGALDPEFVEEYQEYLQYTINTLAAENKLSDIGNLQNQIKTPEDYFETGFLDLPKRPKDAMSGTEFMEKILGVDPEEYRKNPRQLGSLSKIDRENAILEQIELGNVPDFLRRPKPVIISGPDGGEIKTYVMPDYIAIGSNKDFIRVPLSPILAQALARKYNLSLPTKTIVEETYLQSDKRVVGPFYSLPREMEKNSAYLDSSGFYWRSNDDIQSQLKDVPLGTLVSGGKKELVVSPFVAQRFVGCKIDESIAFYGLYDEKGIPIQRTPGHGGESGYQHTEYALGIRFVSPLVVYRNRNGEKKVIRMEDALQSRESAQILSRLERTDEQWKVRSTLIDGPFDPRTVYQQKPRQGQKMPKTPQSPADSS